MTCPVFGSVYRVDLVTIKQTHAEEEAESQMVELEQRVSRKRTTTERAGSNGAKRVKGRGKGKGKEDAPMIEEPSAQALADDEVLQTIVDLECASDDDVQIVLPKASRGNADKQAQRKREQELKKETQDSVYASWQSFASIAACVKQTGELSQGLGAKEGGAARNDRSFDA